MPQARQWTERADFTICQMRGGGATWAEIGRAFAPKQVLEYVVVHELAHLKLRSHSDIFWTFLASIFPSYEKPKAWLEVHQGKIDDDFLKVSFA